MFKIAKFELKKLLRDHRWLLIFMIQPIVVIVLLGSVTRHEPQDINVALYNKNNNQYSKQIVSDLKVEKKLIIYEYSSENEAKNQVNKDKVRGTILVDISKSKDQIGGKITFIDNATLSGSLSNLAKLICIEATKDTLADFTVQNIKANFTKKSIMLENFQVDTSPVKIVEKKNTTKNIKFFDFFSSALIVLLLIIVGLNTSSTTITQERIDGTFERFFVTPYSKMQMILGKMLAFSLVSLALSILTIAALSILFQVTLGPIWLVLLITFLTSLAAISLGVLVSALTYTIAESIQVSILLFFSCLILTRFLFFPETMSKAMVYLSAFIPFTYSVKAMREINILNMGFMDVWQNIAIVFGSMVLFLTLAIIFLRRRAD